METAHPSTFDHVSRTAARTPERVALVANGRIVAYAALRDEIARTASALRGLGIRPGETAAAGFVRLHDQLVVVTALEALGAVPASFRVGEGAECAELLAASDRVLTDGPPPPGGRRLIALPRAWAEQARESPADPGGPSWPALGADAPLAVVRSSGTTGRPKRILLTRAMFDARATQRIAAYGVSGGSRYFAAMHLSVHSVHVGIATAWRLGGIAMTEDRMSLADALAIYRPSHVTLLPRQTEELLAALPVGFARLDCLTLVSLGARLSPRLRAAVLARLAGRVVDHYGTNEAGLICALDPDGAGAPAPGLAARIEDGRLLVAGPSVAAGYLDEPELTARHFQDGWFASGDRADELPDGRLLIAGRDGDVLNAGGLKLACADVEAEVASVPGVLDCAAFQTGEDGLVTVAFVAGQGEDARAVAARVASALPAALSGAEVRAAAFVPRTAQGKIRREELLAALNTRNTL